MKEGVSISANSLLRLHSLCLVIACLSSSTSTTTAFQFSPSSGSEWTTSTTYTSSLSLSMTVTPPRKLKPKTASLKSSVEKQTPTTKKSILEDGQGHINRDLAETLWNWEQQHRQNAKLPKVSFSTRQGLRLVDEIVSDIANSPRGQKLLQGSEDLRTDLVQEGVVALMDALNDYRQSDATPIADKDPTDKDPNQVFENYARPLLEDHLWSTLDRTARPVQLPETESNVWRHIQRIRPQLQDELGGRQPTIKELADRLELPTETLQLLLAARRASLSVESTVEIKQPDKDQFTDQDEWDAQEGHLLDTGDGVLKQEVLVEEYQDEMYQYEGEDEMWIHQTQVAAPLRELIPDAGPSPDDLAMSELIRHDVGEFLTKTLTPQEVQVVRMSFGLDGGKQVVWEEIAFSLHSDAKDCKELMTAEEVKKLVKGALTKLRHNYRINYVETYLEDERDFYGEDTV